MPMAPQDANVLSVSRLNRTLESTPLQDLTMSQFRVLGLLADESRASAIAERLAVSRPTISGLIDGLVERGLVAREVAPDDRRAISLSVTQPGQAAVAAAQAALDVTLDGVLARCADPAAVRAALGQLAPALDSWFSERRATAPTGTVS